MQCAGSPIRVGLYTSDGVRLQCLDEATGECSLGEHEEPLGIRKPNIATTQYDGVNPSAASDFN
jgi:hypothetical protein